MHKGALFLWLPTLLSAPPNRPFSSQRPLERRQRPQGGAGAHFGNHWSSLIWQVRLTQSMYKVYFSYSVFWFKNFTLQHSVPKIPGTSARNTVNSWISSKKNADSSLTSVRTWLGVITNQSCVHSTLTGRWILFSVSRISRPDVMLLFKMTRFMHSYFYSLVYNGVPCFSSVWIFVCDKFWWPEVISWFLY